MKISTQLPQCTDEPTLLCTLGRRLSVFYVAYSGAIEKVASVEQERRKYSDREGMFVSGKSKRGAVYEMPREETRRRFAKMVAEKARDMVKVHGVSRVYLFEPSYMKGEIEHALAANVKKLIVRRFSGNFTKAHPFDLLKKIT